MKKIGEYTARGSIRTDGSINRITLDDGSFETAFRIVEFVVAPHDMDNQTTRVITSKLITDDDTSTGVNWNWDDNAEIAWSIFGYDANATQYGFVFNQLDPDNLVVQDLYILADEGQQSVDIKVNYFVKMEKYDITDSQGALAMVRNRSQA